MEYSSAWRSASLLVEWRFFPLHVLILLHMRRLSLQAGSTLPGTKDNSPQRFRLYHHVDPSTASQKRQSRRASDKVTTRGFQPHRSPRLKSQATRTKQARDSTRVMKDSRTGTAHKKSLHRPCSSDRQHMSPMTQTPKA